MKKRIALAATLAMVGVAAIAPAADAHKLSQSYARSAAQTVALDWYLSAPSSTWDDEWVNGCVRHSSHKVVCDANVAGPIWTPETSQLPDGRSTHWVIQTCWKHVYALLRGERVTYRIGAPRCIH